LLCCCQVCGDHPQIANGLRLTSRSRCSRRRDVEWRIALRRILFRSLNAPMRQQAISFRFDQLGQSVCSWSSSYPSQGCRRQPCAAHPALAQFSSGIISDTWDAKSNGVTMVEPAGFVGAKCELLHISAARSHLCLRRAPDGANGETQTCSPKPRLLSLFSSASLRAPSRQPSRSRRTTLLREACTSITRRRRAGVTHTQTLEANCRHSSPGAQRWLEN
jgi:hypothetical protein